MDFWSQRFRWNAAVRVLALIFHWLFSSVWSAFIIQYVDVHALFLCFSICTWSQWESSRWIIVFINHGIFFRCFKEKAIRWVWSVFSYRVEFWRLIDFKPGVCLLKLCEFPLTREHMSSMELLNPLKGSSSEVTVTYVHIGFQSITSA